MNITGIVLLTGYILNVACIVFILFFEEGDSARRFSWLLAIAFIPVAGVFLYILFSGNFFTRTKRMLSAAAQANALSGETISDQHKNLEELIRSDADAGMENYASLLHMNLVYGKSPILAHNSVWIFKSGEEKYRSLFAELENARHTIHLSYFIINNDETGKRLVEILARKAADGVTVRLLYDHVGSYHTPTRLFTPLVKAGGLVSRFFPVSPINPFSINYRNHRKIAVIDGRSGYFGGMNIGDEYANANHARAYYWRDTHVRIAGPAVQLLQKQFLVDWYTATYRDRNLLDPAKNGQFFFAGDQPVLSGEERSLNLPAGSRTDGVPIQIVSAGPDDMQNDQIRDALILMITKAKKSVYIETPYFTPDATFFTALKIAALSGIDVRIILPDSWDKWYVRLAAMPYVSRLLSYGVRFWHYPGFIHSKMFVVDELIATIGSTNVDTRSFSLHFELNAFFYSDEFGRKCARMFLDDEKISRPASAEWFAGVSVFRKAIWNFFRLFSPLL